MQKEQIPLVVKKILPSVVSITISKKLTVFETQSFPFFGYDEFFAVPKGRKKVKIGGGSGFIIDSEGLILTNRHVVTDPTAEYMVVLDDDSKKFKAKILARDPLNDFAVLQIKAKNLPILDLGDSSKLELGQTVIAIGNALGFPNTVSAGVVSGLSREIMGGDLATGKKMHLTRLIQTDAAINPGNSGGPLVDLSGKVIGINTAVVFLAENISFALPINPAKKIISDIKKYGRIKTPFLGVKYIPITKELQKKYQLPVNFGALLAPMGLEKPIVPKSPAEKAGLKEGDIILEVAKEKIVLKNPLEEILQKFQVDDEIELKILRGKKQLKLKAKLEERK